MNTRTLKFTIILLPLLLAGAACAAGAIPLTIPAPLQGQGLPFLSGSTPMGSASLPGLTASPGELSSPATPTPLETAKPVCPGGDCANLCVDRESVFQPYNGKPGSPPRSSTHIGGPDNSVPLTTYQVTGDQLSTPTDLPGIPAAYTSYQQDTAAHQKIWQYFTTIIPADQRQQINEFVVFTDGLGGILASVGQNSADTGHWSLRVDIIDSRYPKDITYSLLHEFGHLLTLNDSQVTPDTAVMANPDDQQLFQRDAANCPQFFATNGCTQPGSYLDSFYQKFWVKLYPQWTALSAEKNQKNYEALLGQFYANHQSQFVTPYSVTSPEEDIAESWAKFIFSRKPSGSDIASKKVLFFYNYPQLVDLRTRIVNGICSYTAKR